MTAVLPRVTAYQQAHPGEPFGYAYILWLSAQWRRFHAGQPQASTHRGADHHDCPACAAANNDGAFDAWLQEAA